MYKMSWQKQENYAPLKRIIVFLTFLSCVFLLPIISFTQNCVTIVDDFSVDHPFTQAIAAMPANGIVVSGGLGGERDIFATLNTGSAVGGFVTGGQIIIGINPVTDGSVLVAYDGIDGDATVVDPTGLGGINLSMNGAINALMLTVDESDVAGTVILTFYTDAGNISSYTINLPVAGLMNEELIIPFADFTTTMGTGADFTNIGAFTLEASGPSLDLLLSEISAVSTLTASKSNVILTDQDMNGQVNPGDVVRYTVAVKNEVINNASGTVNYTSAIPANTSLVVGSVTTTLGTVTTGNTAGDNAVAINLGTIAGNGTATITYDVEIDDPLDCMATGMSCQGMLSDGNGLNLPTFDPSSSTCNAATETVLTNQLPEVDIAGDFDFGTVMTAPGCLPGPITKTYTINNTGMNDLIISSVTSGSSEFVVGNFSTPLTATIAPNGSLTFDVVFTPQMGASGNVTSMITVNSNDCDEATINNMVTVMADETAPEVGVTPDISFSDISVVPGCSVANVTQILTINNTGTEALNITSLGITGAGFSVSGASFPAVVPANGMLELDVTFTPTANVAGTFVAAITINTDDCDEAVINRTATIATNLNVGAIGVTGDLDFGDVMVGMNCPLTPVVKTLTLNNTGTGTLEISSLISDNPAFVIQNPSKPLPTTLVPTEALTIDLVFTPTIGAVGLSSANVTINSGDCTTPVLIRPAQAMGNDMVCAEEPEIPTMEQWGLLIFGLLTLNLGLMFVYRKEQV